MYRYVKQKPAHGQSPDIITYLINDGQRSAGSASVL